MWIYKFRLEMVGEDISKPPLRKGRCQPKGLTEGLSIPSHAVRVTAPFAQGGLFTRKI